MWPNPLETGDLVTFTEEILNEKLFLCSGNCYDYPILNRVFDAFFPIKVTHPCIIFFENYILKSNARYINLDFLSL